MEKRKCIIKENPVLVVIIVALLVVIVFGIFAFLNKNKNGSDSVISSLNINKNEYLKCFEDKKFEDKINEDIASYKKATAHVKDGSGTPYSVILLKDGTTFEIPGAYPTETVKAIIDGLLGKTIKAETKIDLTPITDKDHYFGSKDAEVVIVEYSDLECPYCARFHKTVHEVVESYSGKVAWVYRHYPIPELHQNAVNKSLASECVASIGGEESFWKFIDSIYTPVFDPITLKMENKI
jgi:protein-disulfide isomerase